MKDVIWGILVIILLLLYFSAKKRTAKRPKKPESYTEAPSLVKEQKEELPIQGAYNKCWMFSYNEKDAYRKLKPIAEELGYTVFAKVRLLDLLEPVKGIPRYKTYFYKIQAKHVDFVLCDQKLVARHIIELDDSSHNIPERQIRDKFVDEVFKSVGYNIIHVEAINDSIRNQLNIREKAST